MFAKLKKFGFIKILSIIFACIVVFYLLTFIFSYVTFLIISVPRGANCGKISISGPFDENYKKNIECFFSSFNNKQEASLEVYVRIPGSDDILNSIYYRTFQQDGSWHIFSSSISISPSNLFFPNIMYQECLNVYDTGTMYEFKSCKTNSTLGGLDNGYN